jgi:hypothetical protein
MSSTADDRPPMITDGNWMWTEAAWGGSYHDRGDIPLPTDTIIDFWDTNKPASHLNGTAYEVRALLRCAA